MHDIVPYFEFIALTGKENMPHISLVARNSCNMHSNRGAGKMSKKDGRLSTPGLHIYYVSVHFSVQHGIRAEPMLLHLLDK